MSLEDQPKFDHLKPCLTCKAKGSKTGFQVNPDCPDCLGTGSARKEK